MPSNDDNSHRHPAAAAPAIDQLLPQITRRFRGAHKVGRPHDAAAAAVGRQLAQCTTTTTNDNQHMRILNDVLADPQVHPSVVQGYFEGLQERIIAKNNNNVPLCCWEFLPQWVVHLEGCNEDDNNEHSLALTSSLETLGVDLVKNRHRNKKKSQHQQQHDDGPQITAEKIILDTWRSFRKDDTRYQATHCVLEQVFSVQLVEQQRPSSSSSQQGSAADHQEVLSALLASTLLSRSSRMKSSTAHHQQSILQCLFRHLWNLLSSSSSSPSSEQHALRLLHSYLEWLLVVLEIYLTITDLQRDKNAARFAAFWMLDWIELTSATAAETTTTTTGTLSCDVLLQRFLCRHVPRVLHCSGYSSLSNVLETATQRCLWPFASSTTTTTPTTTVVEEHAVGILRLASHCLSTPIARDRYSLLLLLDGMPVDSTLALQLIVATTSILKQDPLCHESACSLQQRVLQELSSRNKRIQHTKDNEISALFGLRTSSEGLVRSMIQIPSFAESNFSAPQQMAVLLFGIVVFLRVNPPPRDEDASDTTSPPSTTFLRNLLVTYPHLAVPLLSVIMDRIIQSASPNHQQKQQQHQQQPPPEQVLADLEFMCETLVVNSHCARELWQFVGVEWMQPYHSPLALRIALLRLFPKLVQGNKRLYRRVLDVVGAALAGKEMGLRLAAAATLTDLAASDSIRDVSDVIGWLQNLLTEDHTISYFHTLLVHYAILSLHHLVVWEELDFDVTLKVFNKKLCNIGDHEAIVDQPLVVIESMVLLLGDGECGKDDSDDEDQPEQLVSPQVRASVDTLLFLGTAVREFEVDDSVSEEAVLRIRRNIVDSLSKYSFEALGIDEDSIREAVVDTEQQDDGKKSKIQNRYTKLRDLLAYEIRYSFSESHGGSTVTDLAAALLEIEEEVLGAALWQKRRKPRLMTSDENPEEPVSELVPSLGLKGTPFDLHAILGVGPALQALEQDHSPASSVALLLSSDGTKLLTLRDHADSCLEISDPLLVIFCIQGFLNFASMIAVRQAGRIQEVISEIRSWCEIFLGPDAMHLALSCLSIFIPVDLCSDGSEEPFVDGIGSAVDLAFKNNDFQNDDYAKICISMVGVACFRSNRLDFLDEIIDLLEQSIRGYGGEQTFGAYFGLGLIAQAVPKDVVPASEKHGNLICHIAGFILEDLVGCFEDIGSPVADVVASVKKGRVSPGLVNSLRQLESSSISVLVTKQVVARYMFLSCALALPALPGDLLLAIFRLLDLLEWGCGKATALPAVVRSCCSSGFMSDALLGEVYVDYVAALEQRLSGTGGDSHYDAMEDLCFAVKGIGGDTSLGDATGDLLSAMEKFDDYGRASFLVASFLSVASISCLGLADLLSGNRLHDRVGGEEIKSVVQSILEAISANDRTKFCSMGKILLGVMSSMNDSDQLPGGNTQGNRNPARAIAIEADSSAAGDKISRLRSSPVKGAKQVGWFDVQSLPNPHSSTLLAEITGLIEYLCSTPSVNGIQVNTLSNALFAVHRISLPEEFANYLLDQLLCDGIAPLASVSLLAAQISMRRRAYSSGHSFIALATRKYTTQMEQLQVLLVSSTAQTLFVEKLADVAPKLALDNLQDCLLNLWRICQDYSPREMVPCFLLNMARLLVSTAVSPKAMAVFRELALGRLFVDLYSMSLDEFVATSDKTPTSLLDLYVRCLKEVPHSNLEEASFLVLEEGSDIGYFRALLILRLIAAGYFDLQQRKLRELSNIAAWVSNAVAVSTKGAMKSGFQRVACAFASVMVDVDLNVKRERLTTVFEGLLLADGPAVLVALELLAVLVYYWCRGDDNNGDLSLRFLCSVDLNVPSAVGAAELQGLFRIMLEELPYSLATFAGENKLSSTVSNLLYRLLQRMTSSAVGKFDVDKNAIAIVQRAFVCCQDKAANDDTFPNFVSSLLSASPGQHTL